MKNYKKSINQITKRIRIVTREEESKISFFLKNAPRCMKRQYYPQVADLVTVLLDTGIRLGEALELQHEDINFESNLITIRMSKSDRHRQVPMTKRVADILGKNNLSQQKPFILNAHQIQIAWGWVRSQLEVNNSNLLVLHSLRQTCASRLIKVGVAQDLIEEWLFNSRNRGCRRLEPFSSQHLNHAVKLLEKYED